MTKEMNICSWNGFSASVPGSGHIRHGIPCQDASAVQLGEHPAVIVCDGRGSAKLSHFGAQDAVRSFKRQTAILTPLIANILDNSEATPEMWDKFCKIIFRTLMQVKLDLAEEHDCSEKEFDFTVALAVVGKEHIGCFQVGDGALVLWDNEKPATVFPPDKGEFANQTHFLRLGGENKDGYHSKLFPASQINGISATSDGPEHLMFKLEDMTPGRIFDQLFSDLAANELCQQDLMDYLTRKEWNNDPRGTDDRSIAIIGRIKNSPFTNGENEADACEQNIEEDAEYSNEEISAQNETIPMYPEETTASQEKHVIKQGKVKKHTKNFMLFSISVATLTALSGLGCFSWREHRSLQTLQNEFMVQQQKLTSQQKQIHLLSEHLNEQTILLKRIKPCNCGAEKFSTAEDEFLPEAGAIPASSTIYINFDEKQ